MASYVVMEPPEWEKGEREAVLVRDGFICGPCQRLQFPQEMAPVSAQMEQELEQLTISASAPCTEEPCTEIMLGSVDRAGYEIVDDLTAIDLSTLIRDAVLMDLPVRVLCREDCQGLCPVCGTDRNREDCGHRPEAAPDPRWAKLAELDLPES